MIHDKPVHNNELVPHLHVTEGRNFIETVWGRGYVLREPHEEEVRIPA